MPNSCEDLEEVRVVRVVARNIDKLSTKLIECADKMAEEIEEEEEEDEEEEGEEAGRGGKEVDQKLQENAELLRRDWSSQVSKLAEIFLSLLPKEINCHLLLQPQTLY